MFRIRLLAGVTGGVVLGLIATGASAGILGSGVGALNSAAPRSSIEKVHEGKGGMHDDRCLRHPAPGAYPDCHVHLVNPKTGEYEIRRRQKSGVPCPTDCKWEPPKE